MTPASLPKPPGRWFASIWLVYLGFVFLEPYLDREPLWQWVLAVVSVVVFVPLYFGAFRTAQRRPWRARAMNVVGAVMGLALVPINSGGSTYVIYAAAGAGFLFHRRLHTIGYVTALAVALTAVTVLTRQPFQYWMIFQPMIVLMVGVGNIVAAEERQRNVVLRRAQEDVEEMAKVAERERIARDLHDVLGHTLSVIVLKSELASKLAEIDPARAVREIREVEQVSRTALTEVRAAVEGYRGKGLRGELANAAQVLSAAGVKLDADVTPVELAPKQETVLALALREAVTNVVRHARATMCRVSLTRQPDGVVLRVEDDGVGGALCEGHGLAGMRERVASVGGTLTVESTRGLALTVTLR